MSIHEKSGISLDSILNAISAHPLIKMKSAETEAARKRISQRSSLSDPMVMLGVQNLPVNSLRFDQDMMTSKMIGVSENFPFFGKLSNERSIAEKEVHSLEENTAEEENRLRRDVRLAFFDIYHLQQSIETNRSHGNTISDLIRLSEESLSVGKGSQQEVLALKLEKAQTESVITDEESMMRMRLADLSEASNLDISSVQFNETSGLIPFTQSIGLLDSLASVFRPALLALYSETDQSNLQIERAHLLTYPDFTFGLFYMQRDAIAAMRQSDMVAAQLSFNIPIFSGKLKDAVAEQEAFRTAKHEEINAKKLEIHSMLQSLMARMEGIRRQYSILKEEILSLSELSLSTSRVNYENNKTSMNEVLRRELGVLHQLHRQYQLEADYHKAIAEIEYLTGVEFITR